MECVLKSWELLSETPIDAKCIVYEVLDCFQRLLEYPAWEVFAISFHRQIRGCNLQNMLMASPTIFPRGVRVENGETSPSLVNSVQVSLGSSFGVKSTLAVRERVSLVLRKLPSRIKIQMSPTHPRQERTRQLIPLGTRWLTTKERIKTVRSLSLEVTDFS